MLLSTSLNRNTNNQTPGYNQSYPETSAFHKLGERLNTSIIMITHMNKNSENYEDKFNGMMGSAAIRGASDFNIALVKNPNEAKQTLLLIESRKAQSSQLVLERAKNGQFISLGTTDELDTFQEKQRYIENPVVVAISNLLLDKANVTIKATELLEQLPEWWSYGKSSNRSSQSLGYAIGKAAYNLKRFDQITFTSARNRDGTYYTFIRPKNKITFSSIRPDLEGGDDYGKLAE